MIWRMALCPASSAPIISSSVTIFAPASTIMMASALPATMRSSRLVFRCSCVGLMMYWPSIRPTLTLPSVFWKGMLDKASAAEAPVTASTSVSLSLSADSTSAMICVSRRHPDGKSGRSGRSIRRLVSTSFSAGLPSRLKKPPGMRPDA